MRKIVVSAAILVFLFSGALAGVVNIPASGDNDSVQLTSREINFSFPDVSTYESGDYEKIAIDGCSHIYKASYPSMPYKSEVLTFPFGTKIESIDVKVDNIQTMHIGKKIIPAAEPVRADMSNAKLIRKEGEI
ncbi:MAG: hypothetical protein J7J34_06220, partial [Thermoplasmata archaeon]|nr:hypothetical protein [Thermoplasmata archaeon]